MSILLRKFKFSNAVSDLILWDTSSLIKTSDELKILSIIIISELKLKHATKMIGVLNCFDSHFKTDERHCILHAFITLTINYSL